jgi:hypothetical protein
LDYSAIERDIHLAILGDTGEERHEPSGDRDWPGSSPLSVPPQVPWSGPHDVVMDA